MYETVLAKWLPNYEYTSIGLKADNIALDTKAYESVFEQEFLAPTRKVFGYQDDKEIEAGEIAFVIRTLTDSGLKCWYRVYKTIIADYFVKGNDPRFTIDESVAKFLKAATPVYAMCFGGKTFTAYTIKGNLVGTYPDKVCILGNCDKFKKYAPEIKELIRKDPTTLPDATLMAIKNAVNAGIVNETALRSVMYPIPDYSTGSVINRSVRATDNDMPGYFVRRLIKNLPEATIAEAESPYHAALKFAYTDPTEYRSAISELEEIITKLGDDTLQITPAQAEQLSNGVDISQLNRDNVMEWLHVTYGISYDNLNAILIPTINKTYGSPLLADSNLEDMSAQQFLDAMDNESTGYIDDIVKAYCHEIGMSHECTIAQLLESIDEGGVVKTPVPLLDQVAEYVSAKNLPNELTVEELCASLPHTPTDKLSVTMDTLNECPVVDDELCDMIAEALEEQLTMSDNPPKKLKPIKVLNQDNVMEFLVDNGIAPELANAIVVDHSSVQDIAKAYAMTNPDDLGVKSEVTEDDVITYLTRAGIPRAVANEVVTSGKLPEAEINEEEVYKQVLSKRGISAEMAERMLTMLNPETVEAVVKQSPVNNAMPERPTSLTTNFGYVVGEQILAETRAALQRNDSLDKHAEMRPVMACFIRLLMCFLTDKNNVMDMLKEKEEIATGEAKTIIQNAITTLSK